MSILLFIPRHIYSRKVDPLYLIKLFSEIDLLELYDYSFSVS